MSSYIGDLNSIVNSYAATAASSASRKSDDTNSTSLGITDFLTLMVAQFQNQSLDSTADTSDMLNQLVQMTVVQAMSEMSEAMKDVSDSNVMTYTASLVGKEVTVAAFDEKGNFSEKVGTVTGTAVYNGEHVLYVDGESYTMSQLMAVGRLPEE